MSEGPSGEPTKKKRLVLNAKFASELKTELAVEAAGTERALAGTGSPAVAAAPPAAASPVAAVKKEQKPAAVPKEKEEDQWIDFDDDRDDHVSPYLSGLSLNDDEADGPVVPFDRPVVFQMGSEALEGPAKLVRFQSGAMALVVGDKRYMLERGMAPSNNQMVGRLNAATRELVIAANCAPGGHVVLTQAETNRN